MRKLFPTFAILVSILGAFSCEDTKKENNEQQEQVTVKAPAQKTDAVEHITNTFEETVYNVIEAFEDKNDDYLNTIISKKHGVVVLYRTGVFNEYKHIDKIDFNNPVPENFAYPAIATDYKLKYKSLPAFNCGTMEWSKHGLFCDKVKKDTLLSGTPMNLRKYRGDSIADSEIAAFKDLEKNSRRIVLATPKGDLIFYLALLENKWYLTVIDRITTDCSA